MILKLIKADLCNFYFHNVKSQHKPAIFDREQRSKVLKEALLCKGTKNVQEKKKMFTGNKNNSFE